MSKFTKLERQYVKGIIQNLSLQRFNDYEIVDWFREEKQIKIDRSSITKIRNQSEKEAEFWYEELRESGARYIALYKQRLDSLLSYQKKLHELINKHEHKSPELVIRAISELHKLELSLHMLMKELPGDITTSREIEVQAEAQSDRENQINGPELKSFAEWYENVREIGLMTQEIGRTQYDAYVKEWNNGMFGPDPSDPKPPKSIVRESAAAESRSPSPPEEPEPDSESSSWPESDFRRTRTETDAQVQTDTETGIVIQPSQEPESAIKFKEGKPQQQKQRESHLDEVLGKPELSTEIGNESGRELEETMIKGPGQKHELGNHCTQCHGIYLSKASYNKHECMQGFT